MLLEVLELLLYDAIFIGLFLLLLLPLATYKRAGFAVLKRNFVGYFSNPTGYVFLCIFVLLTSYFAFWPHEFFNANLANLDQLNKVIPFVMLVYVPAITMSIWAEERRQGTDELLLTLPAGDFDIVIGKFLAALSIFSASLLFSQLSNYSVLAALSLGELDTGLFFTTYVGYWMIGLAMLSIGMAASFLTSNLTIGFILGMLFNVPLVLASNAELIVTDTGIARYLRDCGIGAQFEDFGRGVISLSSVVYFLSIAAVGLYVSMVLIAKRHWYGGRDGDSKLVHYLLRGGAVVAMSLGFSVAFTNWNFIRVDTTEGQVASLSSKTYSIIRSLKPERPIYVEAFVSAPVPEAYVQTKRDLISLLKEFDKSSSDIKLTLHEDIAVSSEEAAKAEERYNITARQVRTRTRGRLRDDEVILGVVFRSGLEKVVIPFFDYGMPVEYELIRSIATVAKQRRARLGVVRTDAQLHGGFTMAGGRPQQIPKQAIVDELEKQYEVEEVDPTQPIKPGRYDVLLVVQPSSLAPAAFDNVLRVIEQGQPTAIFEDPRPDVLGYVTGTGDPKQSPGGMGMMGMGRGGPPMPKGDIQKLWRTLGLQVDGERGFDNQFRPHIAWQEYLPYPQLERIASITDEWVFASNQAPGGEGSISDASQVTSQLAEILFPAPGYIKKRKDSDLEFTPLVQTGQVSGTIPNEKYQQNLRNPMGLQAAQGPATEQRYTLAAHIRGKAPATAEDEKSKADSKADDKKDAGEDDQPRWKNEGINVIYVADIDVLATAFFMMRARPNTDDQDQIRFNFENVVFVLNIVDELSKDDSFIPIRKRKPVHYTLALVEYHANQARENEVEQRNKFEQEFKDEREEAEEKSRKAVAELEKEIQKMREDPNANPEMLRALLQRFANFQELENRRLAVVREQLARERQRNINRIRRQSDTKISNIQNQFKAYAILIPPIPPLIVGLLVWMVRMLREREGVSRKRLR